MIFLKRALLNLLTVFLILLLCSPASAQWRKIQEFKKVEVAFNMIHEDLIIKKGQFDFEVWNNRSLNMFQLKIIKKGKALCVLPGKVLRDELPGARGQKMEEVPEEPTLKMTRIPARKIAYIIFETGKLTQLFPGYIIRFEVGYE